MCLYHEQGTDGACLAVEVAAGEGAAHLRSRVHDQRLGDHRQRLPQVQHRSNAWGAPGLEPALREESPGFHAINYMNRWGDLKYTRYCAPVAYQSSKVPLRQGGLASLVCCQSLLSHLTNGHNRPKGLYAASDATSADTPH